MPDVRASADTHDWLTLVALPNYAHELNPAKGVWSLIKRGSLADLLAAIRFALKRSSADASPRPSRSSTRRYAQVRYHAFKFNMDAFPAF
jgi:hypothetical protein